MGDDVDAESTGAGSEWRIGDGRVPPRSMRRAVALRLLVGACPER